MPALALAAAIQAAGVGDAGLAAVGDSEVFVSHFGHQHRQHLLDGKRAAQVGMVVVRFDHFEQIPEPLDERVELATQIGKLA